MKLLYSFFLMILAAACHHPVIPPEVVFESQLVGSPEFFSLEHRATLLQDGRVMVSGGAYNGYSHEIYQPATRGWIRVDSSFYSHESHGLATLPDGKVLAMGGYQSQPANPNGSGGGKRIDAKAEIFDPHTGQWTLIHEMNLGRANFSTTTLGDGSVMVAGGFFLDSSSGSRVYARLTSRVERYLPHSGAWEEMPPMIRPRAGHEALKLPDGKVLVIGGESSVISGEIYHSQTNQWSAIASLDSGYRRDYRTTLIDDDHLLLTGGIHDGVVGITKSMIYTFSTNSWKEVAPMHEPRFNHTLVQIREGKILAAGGRGLLNNHPFYPTTEATVTCEIYDAQKDEWTLVGNLQTRRSGHLSVRLNDTQFLIVGGTINLNSGAEILTIVLN